jgi:hypothetical protein
MSIIDPKKVLRQDSCAVAYMENLASAAYWEAERIGKFNKHLRRINKT